MVWILGSKQKFAWGKKAEEISEAKLQRLKDS